MAHTDIKSSATLAPAFVARAVRRTCTPLAKATFVLAAYGASVLPLWNAAQSAPYARPVVGPSWLSFVEPAMPLLLLVLVTAVWCWRRLSLDVITIATGLGVMSFAAYLLMSTLEVDFVRALDPAFLPRWNETNVVQMYGNQWLVLTLYSASVAAALRHVRRTRLAG